MSKDQIRALGLCLFRHGNRILVARDYDSVKQDYYCRPLGGGIKFGEKSRDAVVREIREELGGEIEDVRFLGTLENIFTLEGEPGHEIVLVFDATFVGRSLYERDVLVGHEHEIGTTFLAEWKSVEELANTTTRLVPDGLASLIEE